MRAFVTVLALAALVATAAVAKTVRPDFGKTYQSDAQGYQSYANRLFGNGNEPPGQ
jgi:hypothetical protein